MLVTFKFRNFGPFNEEQIFDMRAIKSYKEHPYNLVNENDTSSLLKVVALYGANASGKSNFMKAYRCFSSIVKKSFTSNEKTEKETVLEEYYHPFQLDDDSYIDNTEFEAIYHLNGTEYRYGYIYNSKQIEYEWLYKKSLSTNRQMTILERHRNSFVFGASVKKTCDKYIENIDCDVLALSFLSSLKLSVKVFKDTLKCITDVFTLSLSCDGQSEYMLNQFFKNIFLSNEEEKKCLIKFLKAIDVGIIDIEVEKNKENIAVYTYHMGKDGKKHRFPFEIESDGTKKAIAIFSLVRLAAYLDKGLIIDEFNSQLHPLLQKYIIDLFYEESSKGQLIYTTHDTSLLDKQFMRRDQVWFTDKDQYGQSSLYSLAEFKIRNDKSFGKDYLNGIYGGIPILRDFSFKE